MTNRLSLIIALAALVAGCSSTGQPSHTAKGAATGGLLGGLAGGVIGHQSGETGAGAAIGAGVGAVAGGLMGNRADRRAEEITPNSTTVATGDPAPARATAVPPTPAITPIALSEIVNYTKQGRTSTEIIDEIQRTRSVYRLNTEDINYLKSNNVSDQVIDYMLATGRL